ncbi:MAG: hypothetical protein J6A28_00885 [Clostridia bacterium]|nr:hypothetical protein [Clostridia bacterium]
MAEIPQLDMKLADEGWDLSGGKSFNVWGFVDFPADLLAHINKYRKKLPTIIDPLTGLQVKTKEKRSPVWTAYDKFFYYNKPTPDDLKNLPKISATFKSAFEHKFSPIVENLGMRIAIALDLPTSYNYIAAFDPEKYPEIINNYPTLSQKNTLQPFGIVSIDFLQPRQTKLKPNGKSLYIQKDEHGKSIDDGIEIESFTSIDGDRLVTFEEALQKYHIGTNKLNGDENLIENWIEVVDQMARKEYKHVPREKLNKMIDDIHSRIARSFLLKDCALGDCDFTAYNGGTVVNSHKMRYAATHDYGDICNNLIKTKFTFDPYCGMTKEVFEKLPINLQQQISQSKQKQQNQSVRDLAQSWASSTSEKNFYYVLQNFPEACREFFANADVLVRKNVITKIVDSYTKMTCNGVPLLSKEEAEIFKEYLTERIVHYCDLYVDYLNQNHQNIPDREAGEDVFL